MATRRLCKGNPDDLKQSWDCVFSIIPATQPGNWNSCGTFFSPSSSAPSFSKSCRRTWTYSPLCSRTSPSPLPSYAPGWPGTAVISCWSRQFRSRSLPSSLHPEVLSNFKSDSGPPAWTSKDFQSSVGWNLHPLPCLTRSPVAWPCWPPCLLLWAWQGHLSVCLQVRRAGTVPACGGSASGFATFTAPCSVQPFTRWPF